MAKKNKAKKNGSGNGNNGNCIGINDIKLLAKPIHPQHKDPKPTQSPPPNKNRPIDINDALILAAKERDYLKISSLIKGGADPLIAHDNISGRNIVEIDIYLGSSKINLHGISPTLKDTLEKLGFSVLNSFIYRKDNMIATLNRLGFAVDQVKTVCQKNNVEHVLVAV